MDRRSLLVGFGALLAAPAIVRAGSLMPVRGIVMPVNLEEWHTTFRWDLTKTDALPSEAIEWAARQFKGRCDIIGPVSTRIWRDEKDMYGHVAISGWR